jgi:hypothetical protein
MDSECYWYRAKGDLVIIIRPSPRDVALWGIWCNDTLLCDDCGSPEEAALRVNKNDFPDQSAKRLIDSFKRLPESLDCWRKDAPPLRPDPACSHHHPKPEMNCPSHARIQSASSGRIVF